MSPRTLKRALYDVIVIVGDIRVGRRAEALASAIT